MLKKIESRTVASIEIIAFEYVMETPGGGGVGGSFLARYVQLASKNLCRILAYVVANYRPHLCSLWGKTGMEWKPSGVPGAVY